MIVTLQSAHGYYQHNHRPYNVKILCVQVNFSQSYLTYIIRCIQHASTMFTNVYQYVCASFSFHFGFQTAAKKKAWWSGHLLVTCSTRNRKTTLCGFNMSLVRNQVDLSHYSIMHISSTPDWMNLVSFPDPPLEKKGDLGDWKQLVTCE